MSWGCKHIFSGSFPSEKRCIMCGEAYPLRYCNCENPVPFKNDNDVNFCSKCWFEIDTKKSFKLFMDKSYIGDNICIKSMLEDDIKGALDYGCKCQGIYNVEIIEESDQVIKFKGYVGFSGDKKQFSYKLIAE